MQNKNSAGNVVIIILVAVALFGALTFTLSKSMNGGSSDELTQAQVELHASKLITYASEAEAVIAQMEFNGASYDDLNFVLPSNAAFETGSDIYKVFHTDGGGLNLKPVQTPPFSTSAAITDIMIRNDFGFEWTPTTAPDIVFVARGLEQSVCEEINRQILADTTIPDMTLAVLVTPVECAGCDGHASMCVYSTASSQFNYYSIIGAQ